MLRRLSVEFTSEFNLSLNATLVIPLQHVLKFSHGFFTKADSDCLLTNNITVREEDEYKYRDSVVSVSKYLWDVKSYSCAFVYSATLPPSGRSQVLLPYPRNLESSNIPMCISSSERFYQL